MPVRVITPRRFLTAFLVAVTTSAITSVSHAQLPQARLTAVFPLGAQAGQNVEV